MLYAQWWQEALRFVHHLGKPLSVLWAACLPPDSLNSVSSPTLLLYQLTPQLSFPSLCLGFGSVFLLWSQIAFLFPEILSFEFLVTKLIILFSCITCCLSWILSLAWHHACPPGSDSWSCFYHKGQMVLGLCLFVWLLALGVAHSLLLVFLDLPIIY